MFKVVASLFIIWAVARFCHHQTDGLKFSKFENNTSPIKEQISPPLPEELKPILKQKFHYLGRGLQSFSFLSEDGTTVLKLFNNRYQNRIFWLKWLPSRHKERKIAYNQKKLQMTFESYQIAIDSMKEETGLLYLHPEATKESIPITLIDKLHIEHLVDLSKKGFALQKKAQMAYSYLESCPPMLAKSAIFSLVNLLRCKMQDGIADRDPLIRTNFGFHNKKAMQIDIGPLSYDPSLKDPEIQKKELERITLSLKHWLEKNQPQMLPYLDEALSL